MKNRSLRKLAALTATGSILLLGECAVELRDAAIGASANYVSDVVSNALTALLPFDDLVQQDLPGDGS